MKIFLAAVILCISALLPNHVVAQADYGCDTYGAGAYEENSCSEQTDSNKNAGGLLSSTGRSIVFFSTIGVLAVVGGGSLLYITLRKNRKK